MFLFLFGDCFVVLLGYWFMWSSACLIECVLVGLFVSLFACFVVLLRVCSCVCLLVVVFDPLLV